MIHSLKAFPLFLVMIILGSVCPRAQELPPSPEPEIREPAELGGEGFNPDAYEIPEGENVDWSRIRGVNYIPSYAASPHHLWKEYNPEIIRLDLARAHQIGFNSVRIFLSFTAYELKPSEFIAHWTDFMEAVRAEGITVMPVLFDSWGVELEQDYSPEAQLGVNGAAKRTETTRTAYDKFRSRPDAYRLDPKTYERMMRIVAEKALPDRPVPVSTDPSAAYWGEWSPSPGHSRLTGKTVERCAGFVKAVIEPYKASPFIAAWDIMNEPDSMRVFSADQNPEAAYQFAGEMIKAAGDAAPRQPVTVGASDSWYGARVFVNKVDLVSLHLVQDSFGELAGALQQSGRRRRPAVVTLCGGIMFPAGENDLTPEKQVADLRQLVLQMGRFRTGFYLWHLIEGRTITPWAAILNADGTPRPAAEMLKREFAK